MIIDAIAFVMKGELPGSYLGTPGISAAVYVHLYTFTQILAPLNYR
ncbi:hypothetical protein [Photorhabdus aballayi]|nr:hypothetical protein [Photorhabdus aballayi]